MTQVKLLDRANISGTEVLDGGDLLVQAACARTGCQIYLGDEIGLVDRAPLTVYRPETAVFNKDSMRSYAGRPVTIGHPKDGVDTENWKKEAVGEVQGDVVRDGETVRVTFRIRDAAAIEAIQNGLREISMGYETPIQFGDGFAPDGTPYQAVQTGPIKINHLALVDQARGGSTLRIGDGASTHWGAAPITMSDKKKETPMSDALQSVVLGDKAVSVSPQYVAIIDAFKADQAKKIGDMQADHKKMVDAKDEEIGALKADKKKLEDAAVTPEKLSKMVADRVALESAVKSIADGIKTDGVSDADLRKAAVAHKLGDDAVKDVSDAEISGMFKAISAKSDQFADAIKGSKPQALNDGGWGSVMTMRKEA